jgi:outer membrane protein OmpA-like peptidoglycan-associated protein
MFAKTLKTLSPAIALTLGLLAANGPATAQEATYLQADASYCQIFRALSRVLPETCAQAGDQQVYLGKTRSLAGGGATRSMGAAMTRGIVQTTGANSNGTQTQGLVYQDDMRAEMALAMPVRFAFDSAKLTAEARNSLDRVAQVLQSDVLQNATIAVEGHADAKGSADYNLALSRARAAAVASYLNQVHGIPAWRLEASGLGESRPYNPANPNDAANRRVEFINLQG